MKKRTAPAKEPSVIDDEGEKIMQIKEKFQATIERSEKVQILMVLPRSWRTPKVQEEFGASNYMVCKAKELDKLSRMIAWKERLCVFLAG